METQVSDAKEIMETQVSDNREIMETQAIIGSPVPKMVKRVAPQKKYIELLNEAVAQVTAAVEQHENARDKVLLDIYAVGQETLGSYFPKFKKTPEYRHIWHKVTAAIKNANKNQNAVQKARQSVVKAWGQNGSHFLQFNSAQGWTKAAGRLARQCPDYTRAAEFIVHAVVERLDNMRSGKSLYLEPGLVDLQRAIGISKEAPALQPVTADKLDSLGVYLDSYGLLRARTTDSSTNLITDHASFEWNSRPDIPQLPRAIIEEPSDSGLSSSEAGDDDEAPNPQDAAGAEAEAAEAETSKKTQRAGEKAGKAGRIWKSGVPKNRLDLPKGQRSEADNESGIQNAESSMRQHATEEIELDKEDQGPDTNLTFNEIEHGIQNEEKSMGSEAEGIESNNKGQETDTDSDISLIETEPDVQDRINVVAIDLSKNEIASILDDIFRRMGCSSPGKVKEILATGYMNIDHVFNWWDDSIYKGKSLYQLADLEAKMFTFHHDGNEASLQSHQYGLLHQLLEVDPVLWILNVCLQKGKKELAALPQPVSKRPNNLPNGLLNRSRITQNGQNEVYITSRKNDYGLLFQPTLLPLIWKNDLNCVGNLTTEEQVKQLRDKYQAVKWDIVRNKPLTTARLPYNIATSLRGLSPLSDAILLQRPYTDPQVQIEMDILLGADRESAWEFIQKWRTAAVQSLILHFSLWVSLEKRAYRDKSYLEAYSISGKRPKTPNRKRDSKDLLPFTNPHPKRPYPSTKSSI
ncbi:TPA_exp: Uncharacterized protein A8136_7100 [Trichophyton benhamiae CBS 112371]|nr:TPA_exp: Uncharacterized protein A8136_7100 [Trichophyton benhamiae CBS 112371]